MMLETNSIIVILIVGLIAGWLAGQIMKGGGFGLIGDIIVGIIGAVIGGVLGNQVGSGDGKKLATVAGAAAGGYAGNKVQQRMQQGNTETVPGQSCETVYDSNDVPAGYKVTYMLDGKQGIITMDHNPGARIPVKNGALVLSNPS